MTREEVEQAVVDSLGRLMGFDSMLGLLEFVTKLDVEQRGEQRLRASFLVEIDGVTYRVESLFDPPYWRVYEWRGRK